jgi:hypothetical protein
MFCMSCFIIRSRRGTLRTAREVMPPTPYKF